MKTKPLKELFDRHFSAEEQAKIRAEAAEIVFESRLQKIRDEVGLSQQQLAELLKVSQAQVSKYENAADMMISTLRRIAAAMHGEVRVQIRIPGHGPRWITLTDFSDPEKERVSA